MEWQFQASTAKAALSARPALAAFLRDSCTPESDCDGAIIAFGELVTNVMVHAPGPIEVLVRADADGTVTIHVCDTGLGFSLAPSLPPPLSESGGRGLYIVSKLCSGLARSRIEGGNKVSAVLPVIAKPSRLHLVRERPAMEDAQDYGTSKG
jgi:anti-sigma regulatory factor (Ser/Thr protein kinase)